MTGYPRYALYFVPSPQSALYRFGADLLGYDAYRGRALPQPADLLQAIPDWSVLTAAPRLYGFHATLKAPFSLAPGTSEEALRAGGAALAGTPRPIPSLVTTLELLGDFIALVPDQPSDALSLLARACVITLDAYRARLTDTDRERRKPATLSLRQNALLERWGYPHVMEEFRFHMTLTGPLPPERRANLLTILRERFAAVDLGTLTIDRVALSRQSEPGMAFQIVEHWPLRG